MPAFSDMLKYLRMREDLSQAELASKLNISKSTISMYEVGKREPDFETLEAIADFFNVDMNFLLGKQKSEPQKFSAKDERDIKKSLDELMESLDNKDGAPLMFDGQEIPQETKELLRNQIDIALHTVKLINKEKYNPHKNKG